MTGYFPGSKRPLAPPPGVPDLIQIDPEYGKVFEIGGKPVRLFTIGELAELLNRTPVTIRQWERLGTIPRATFVKPGANKDPRGRRRLYSLAQVEALVRVAMEEKVLHDTTAKIGRTRFTEKVFAAFKEIQSR